jgi:hypothetical protein
VFSKIINPINVPIGNMGISKKPVTLEVIRAISNFR